MQRVREGMLAPHCKLLCLIQCGVWRVEWSGVGSEVESGESGVSG